MKKKWITSILLCCVFAILLNGCANKPGTSLEAPPSTTAGNSTGTDATTPATNPTDASLSYYTHDGNEAIGWNPVHGSADQIGQSIANGLHDSPGHWRYLGSSEYSFAGAGWCPRGYLVVFVSRENYG